MTSQLTPQQFVENWRNTELSERASYQAHFMDVCRLVGYETPTGSGKNKNDEAYAFEYGIKKLAGSQGFADVFLQRHFAAEYKAPQKYRDLRAAYDQLLQYREQLENPPLLVVTDIQNWEIHTNWHNTEKKVYSFTHEEIATRPSVLALLQNLFFDPAKLHPRRNTEQVTADAASVFQMIADNMRDWQADPQRIAHFLTKIVFCLFAEDVSLLPTGPGGEAGIFSEIVERTRTDTSRFTRYLHDLFAAMADGGDVLLQKIPYFNGSLFVDVRVEELQFEALSALERASRLNWESIEPAIFGTLFERSLDPAKRSQLGAHYTSREDILLIVEPVLMRPLEREWQRIQTEASAIRTKYDDALTTSNRRNQTTYAGELTTLRESMLKQLREIKVLDPACGSGNFLYVALQRLMDMEKAVIKSPLFAGLSEPFPEVHPRQMYGIEKDPIAHALASIVVWIGYLQWRRSNGYTAFKEPILEDLHENIVCKDAILALTALTTDDLTPDPSPHRRLVPHTAMERGVNGTVENGVAIEPAWAAVDVIIGNPPFLGGKKMRGELEKVRVDYVDMLFDLYKGRVPPQADLVCYWFERARKHIEEGKAKRVGLLSTQSIRAGANRTVLENIKETGDIFMAWADRPWVLDGAAVRVSMVGFDNGTEQVKFLDDALVSVINPDLTSSVDITIAKNLPTNRNIAFQGTIKGGAFDIDEKYAQALIQTKNHSGYNNADVVVPWMNGSDVVGEARRMWIIDFGAFIPLAEAEKYEKVIEHIRKHVKPERDKVRRNNHRNNWWIHAESRPGMRDALKPLTRYIATPRVAKHRIFVWADVKVLPDSRIYAIARDDDYFFGVLHSKIHEIWSLRQASRHGVGNDPTYNNSTCFETFPFPFVPGQEDKNNAAYQAISTAAQCLHEERQAWLSPHPPTPSPTGEGEQKQQDMRDRTLTNLYNALVAYREQHDKQRDMPKGIKAAAWAFAPRLAELHDTLDKAVCDAYGWSHAVLTDEEAILRQLLALNLERAN